MNSPFNYFDHIYCVNLDNRPDRWEQCKVEFDKISITDRVERFSAVEAKPGWIGCLKSHIEITKDAKKRGFKNFLVFEDDFLLKDNIEENLSKSLSQLTDLALDWDLLYLGINPVHHMPYVSENLVKCAGGLTTHAYAMSERLYDDIINIDVDNSRQVDVFYTDYVQKVRGKSYCVYPILAIQKDGYSDVNDEEVKYGDTHANLEERFLQFTDRREWE